MLVAAWVGTRRQVAAVTILDGRCREGRERGGCACWSIANRTFNMLCKSREVHAVGVLTVVQRESLDLN